MADNESSVVVVRVLRQRVKNKNRINEKRRVVRLSQETSSLSSPVSFYRPYKPNKLDPSLHGGGTSLVLADVGGWPLFG